MTILITIIINTLNTRLRPGPTRFFRTRQHDVNNTMSATNNNNNNKTLNFTDNLFAAVDGVPPSDRLTDKIRFSNVTTRSYVLWVFCPGTPLTPASSRSASPVAIHKYDRVFRVTDNNARKALKRLIIIIYPTWRYKNTTYEFDLFSTAVKGSFERCSILVRDRQ